MSGTPEVVDHVLEIGGRSRSALVRSLAEAGVQLNPYAEALLAHPAFDRLEPRRVHITGRSVEQLGLARGADLPTVFAAARDRGLELCPLVTGVYLRLAMMSQADAPDSILSAGRSPAGALHVASEPVSDDVEYPKGFYLRVVDGRPWLRGYCCDDTYVHAPEQRFAFVLPTGP